MRKVVPLLFLLLTGCVFEERTSVTAMNSAGLAQQQQNIPPTPLQWETVDELPLQGSISSRLVISAKDDIYYAYAQTLLPGDTPVTGLPAVHLVMRPNGATSSSQFTPPSVDPAATQASIAGLQIDGSGNLYLMVQTTSTFLYRYPSGATTPTAVTMPTSFQPSLAPGSGFFLDRKTATLYIAGSHVTASSTVSSLAVSTDAGTTWSLKDASATNGTLAYGVTTDSNGIIYLAGAMPAKTGTGTAWVLSASADGGTTFNQIDSFQPSSQAAGASAIGEYVASDGLGHFYVTGVDVVDPTTQGQAAVVRESFDNGLTWTETSRFSSAAFPGSTTDTELGLMSPQDLGMGAAGFAVLPILEAKAPSSYLLLRAPAIGGGTWTTSLALTTLSDGAPYIQGAQFDSSGQLYLLANFFKYGSRQSTLRLTRL